MRLSALRSLLILALLLPALGACQWLRPYRIDVRQGSLVTGEMVAKLKVGMNTDQVKFILGTPLLADPFPAQRWDYPYEFRASRSDKAEHHLLSLFFKEGKLERWDGDVKAVTGNEEVPNRVVEITSGKSKR